MLVNGRVRQACTALVDRLLEEQPDEIELRPMEKFPVVRDLVVNRRRLFRALEKVTCLDSGRRLLRPGARPARLARAAAASLSAVSECMSCGCCLDACPQYTKIELEPHEGETRRGFRQARSGRRSTRISSAPTRSARSCCFNTHPTGEMNAGERLDALMAEGGIQVCGNAQNCVDVCPKKIPLTTSIGRAGRSTTVRSIAKWFSS